MSRSVLFLCSLVCLALSVSATTFDGTVTILSVGSAGQGIGLTPNHDFTTLWAAGCGSSIANITLPSGSFQELPVSFAGCVCDSALNAAEDTLYVVDYSGTVGAYFIPTSTWTVLAKLADGYPWMAVSVHPDQEQLILTEQQGHIWSLNLTTTPNTLTQLETAGIGYVGGAQLTLDGSILYVAGTQNGSLVVFNLITNAVSLQPMNFNGIPMSAQNYTYPTALALNYDESGAFLINSDDGWSGTVGIMYTDFRTGDTTLISENVIYQAESLTLDTASNTLYVGDLYSANVFAINVTITSP